MASSLPCSWPDRATCGGAVIAGGSKTAQTPRGRAARLTRSGASLAPASLSSSWPSGDITQVTAANLAARYDPLLVFAGATLGLWAAAAMAVTIGAKSLSLIPMAWVRRITAAILLGFGIYTVVAAVS